MTYLALLFLLAFTISTIAYYLKAQELSNLEAAFIEQRIKLILMYSEPQSVKLVSDKLIEDVSSSIYITKTDRKKEAILKFIKSNQRKPSRDIPEEIELAYAFERYVGKNSGSFDARFKKLCLEVCPTLKLRR